MAQYLISIVEKVTLKTTFQGSMALRRIISTGSSHIL